MASMVPQVENTLTTPPQDKSRAAQPLTADLLLAVEEKQRLRFGGGRITTGCEEIDGSVLGWEDDEGMKGVERGVVLGITAGDVMSGNGNGLGQRDSGRGKSAELGRLISLHLIATILLSGLPSLSSSDQRPASESLSPGALIIDTTGSFPIALLNRVLKARLLRERARRNLPSLPWAQDEVTREVNAMLRMVSISRVFDVEGLWEVLSELGQAPDAQGGSREDARHNETGTEVLVVDDLTSLIRELLARREKAQAQTILNPLAHVLHHLTRSKNILTVLHNGIVPVKSPRNETWNPQGGQIPQHHQGHDQYYHPLHLQQRRPISTFQDINAVLKPALGKIFEQFIDLHLLVAEIPRDREDAEALVAEKALMAGTINRLGRAIRWTNVVEVVRDDCSFEGEVRSEEAGQTAMKMGVEMKRGLGAREGRWGFVEAVDGWELKSAFQNEQEEGKRERVRTDSDAVEGPGGKNIAGSREPDVGSVAKIWGFGGRRV